jgi:hypothetical protein
MKRSQPRPPGYDPQDEGQRRNPRLPHSRSRSARATTLPIWRREYRTAKPLRISRDRFLGWATVKRPSGFFERRAMDGISPRLNTAIVRSRAGGPRGPPLRFRQRGSS